MRDRFLQDVLSNRNNCAILDRLQALELPDGWLVAGCIFQTVWNVRSGAPAEAQIKDYDLFYFDDHDLSPEAERYAQSRAEAVFSDIEVKVEVKNQARVHLWYESYFGYPYPKLRNTCDGIDRFLIPATCVGIRPSGVGLEVYAPNGISLIYEGRLYPNPLINHRLLFDQKAHSYLARWPWLRIDVLASSAV